MLKWSVPCTCIGGGYIRAGMVRWGTGKASECSNPLVYPPNAHNSRLLTGAGASHLVGETQPPSLSLTASQECILARNSKVGLYSDMAYGQSKQCFDCVNTPHKRFFFKHVVKLRRFRYKHLRWNQTMCQYSKTCSIYSREIPECNLLRRKGQK